MDIKGKGISWVGNMYHKFEAIRSEVEDMSKVQGVGVNVKKICAGVMHDLVTSSSVELVKEEGFDLSVQKTSYLGDCKESKAALDDNALSMNVPHKVSEITSPMAKDSTSVSFSTGVIPVKDVEPVCALEQKDDAEDILTKGNESETSEIAEITLPTVEDSSQASFSNDLYAINDLVTLSSAGHTEDIVIKGNESGTIENTEITLSTVEDSSEASFSTDVYAINDDFDKLSKSKTSKEEDVVKEDPHQAGVSEVTDPAGKVQSREVGTQTEMSPQTSADIMIETSCLNGGYIHEETLDQIGHANDSSTALPSSSLSCENQVVETGSTPSNSFSTEPNGMGTLTTSAASKNEFEQYKEPEFFNSPAELGMQGYGDGGAELSECDKALGMDKEAIDKFDNVELKDSCIQMPSKEFFSDHSRKGHHRSYKKKIWDAFASRMRTGKKEEYELLALWYADIDAGADKQRLGNSSPYILSRTLDSKTLPTDDSCESDWEIL